MNIINISNGGNIPFPPPQEGNSKKRGYSSVEKESNKKLKAEANLTTSEMEIDSQPSPSVSQPVSETLLIELKQKIRSEKSLDKKLALLKEASLVEKQLWAQEIGALDFYFNKESHYILVKFNDVVYKFIESKKIYHDTVVNENCVQKLLIKSAIIEMLGNNLGKPHINFLCALSEHTYGKYEWRNICLIPITTLEEAYEFFSKVQSDFELIKDKKEECENLINNIANYLNHFDEETEQFRGLSLILEEFSLLSGECLESLFNHSMDSRSSNIIHLVYPLIISSEDTLNEEEDLICIKNINWNLDPFVIEISKSKRCFSLLLDAFPKLIEMQNKNIKKYAQNFSIDKNYDIDCLTHSLIKNANYHPRILDALILLVKRGVDVRPLCEIKKLGLEYLYRNFSLLELVIRVMEEKKREFLNKNGELKHSVELVIAKGLVKEDFPYEEEDRYVRARTAMEVVYGLYLNPDYKDIVEPLMVAFLEKESPSLELASRMIHSLSHTATPFEPYLIKWGFLTKADQESFAEMRRGGGRTGSGMLSDYIKTSQQIRFQLNRALRIFNMRPQEFPLELSENAKKVKAEIKVFLKKENLGEAEKKELPLLEKEYKQLVEVYDRVIMKVPLLTVLQEMSRDLRIRAPKTQLPRGLVDRLRRFYSLFNGISEGQMVRAIGQRVHALWDPTARKNIWQTLRMRAIDAGKQVAADPFLLRHHIVWLHGTKSSALPAIVKTKALIATGELLRRKLVPICGEICGSHTTINSTDLSGERWTESWEEHSKDKIGGGNFYFDASTRFLVNWVFASSKKGYSETYCFNSEKSKEAVSLEFIKENIKTGKSRQKIEYLEHIRIHCLRLRLTDPEIDKEFKPQIQFLQEQIAQLKKESTTEAVELLECMERLLDAFECKIPKEHIFTKEEVAMINKPPLPIVFAGTSIKAPIKIHYEDQEFLAKGPLALGADINVAFVEKEQVEYFSKYLSHLGVRVYDKDLACYLEMMNMTTGSYFLEKARELSSNTTPLSKELLSSARFFANTLGRDILPGYAIPFSKNPTYQVNGTVIRVENPFYGHGKDYATYAQEVKEGKVLPRDTHGLMHASRVALWARILSQFYNFSPEKQYWVGVAAAMHDFQRGDEGKDYWDEESAMRLKAYLESTRRMEPREAEEYVHALAEKDPEGDLFTSDTQRIVHDADAIEIVRCIDLQSFRKEVLQFLKLKTLDEKFKEQLLNECFDFIRITENLKLRIFLEQNSQDYFGDVVRILGFLHKKNGRFPLLAKLLENDLKAFDPNALGKEVASFLP